MAQGVPAEIVKVDLSDEASRRLPVGCENDYRRAELAPQRGHQVRGGRFGRLHCGLCAFTPQSGQQLPELIGLDEQREQRLEGHPFPVGVRILLRRDAKTATD